ncbi:MAG: hypothetical protein HUJ51_02195 [Eggerthellaceae bacterium]|nr:hypothetical protein [Eggerthellaceae bacterium]
MKHAVYMVKVMQIDLGIRKIGKYTWTDNERRLFISGKTIGKKFGGPASR